MPVAIIFLFGIANFAMHKAVIESRHPMLEHARWLSSKRGQRVALVLEFLVLLAAMLLAGNGWPGLAIAYGIYTCLNGLTAWLILTGRV
ncbi:hypothetical protein [Altererythrobacter sp. GH1-8]|uniref:hypothetical protein n=1 Tax=Altererythrobacter sp. GH1-8 TaxID=3349333 RepID=UPI00374D806F